MKEPSEAELESALGMLRARVAQIAGVQGVGIGQDHLRVYVHDSFVGSRLPKEFNGIRVEAVVTGPVEAQAHVRG